MTRKLDICNLPWLPRLETKFRDQIKALSSERTLNPGMSLLKLASQYLGVNQLIKLSSLKDKLRTGSDDLSPLTPFKLGLVSNGTTDFIAPVLAGSALRYGIDLEVITSDFDQSIQQAIDPGSTINKSDPDAILVLLNSHGLPFIQSDSDARNETYDHTSALQFLLEIVDGFKRGCGAPCLIQTIPDTTSRLFGSMEAGMPGTPGQEIQRFNNELITELSDRPDYLIDVAWLASMAGTLEWTDDRQWYHARLPFSQHHLPLYGDFVCRTIAAIRGKSRKCLILDLDNTLWGGVIGDDGLEGIKIQQGDPAGEAYRSIQKTALRLKERGVILAVCSKNDESIARNVFRNHSDMILKEDDFAVFIANWNDKASNIEAIAQQLDIGLDSLVFLDDNPFEREQVRSELPLVAVPELPDDPSDYGDYLLLSGLFDSISFTDDDRQRPDQYASNAKRKSVLNSARSIDDYLKSLDMVIHIREFDDAGRKRIVQLINKTNQFNLTTKRYTESQVIELQNAGKDVFTVQASLSDRFGDNGMVSILICRADKSTWTIDTWLMSCRVINRKVENEICNYLVEQARLNGIDEIIGVYSPSGRNTLVSNHYKQMGFNLLVDEGGSTTWRLVVDNYSPFETFIDRP